MGFSGGWIVCVSARQRARRMHIKEIARVPLTLNPNPLCNGVLKLNSASFPNRSEIASKSEPFSNSVSVSLSFFLFLFLFLSLVFTFPCPCPFPFPFSLSFTCLYFSVSLSFSFSFFSFFHVSLLFRFLFLFPFAFFLFSFSFFLVSFSDSFSLSFSSCLFFFFFFFACWSCLFLLLSEHSIHCETFACMIWETWAGGHKGLAMPRATSIDMHREKSHASKASLNPKNGTINPKPQTINHEP